MSSFKLGFKHVELFIRRKDRQNTTNGMRCSIKRYKVMPKSDFASLCNFFALQCFENYFLLPKNIFMTNRTRSKLILQDF